jgi:hypothetical protein
LNPPESGPHVRLGVAWGIGTMVAVLAGPLVLALWMAAAAAIAAAEVARTYRGSSGRRQVPPAITAASAAAIVLGASAGWPATVLVMLLVVVVLLAMASVPVAGGRLPVIDTTHTALVAEVIGLAAAAPVVARHHALIPAVVLVLMTMFYDSADYLVGSGANNAWEGPAAALASMAALTVAVAAVFVPPFRGATPWLLGGLAMVTAPLGPIVADRLLGPTSTPLGGYRRLDSLLVLGPAWAIAATFLLH